MFKYVLEGAGTQYGGVFALLIFFGVFTFMLVWVFRKGAKEKYQTLAELPLENEISNAQAAVKSSWRTNG